MFKSQLWEDTKLSSPLSIITLYAYVDFSRLLITFANSLDADQDDVPGSKPFDSYGIVFTKDLFKKSTANQIMLFR